jgi:tRNA(Glu) U13 pseudouridine synthase TruD
LENQDLLIEFFLPKGAFATTVLREFMKNDEQKLN